MSLSAARSIWGTDRARSSAVPQTKPAERPSKLMFRWLLRSERRLCHGVDRGLLPRDFREIEFDSDLRKAALDCFSRSDQISRHVFLQFGFIGFDAVRDIPAAVGMADQNAAFRRHQFGPVSYTHLRAHETPEH